MGFEVNRFQGEVDEELVCPICSGVLEDPLQVRKSRNNVARQYPCGLILACITLQSVYYLIKHIV